MTRDPTPAEFAEAAAWVARLHGPNRNLQTERGFRRWVGARPQHAAAFEAMTAAWEVSAQLPKRPFGKVSRWERAGYRRGFLLSAAATAAAALLLAAGLYWLRDPAITTGIGEQRTLTLTDGTRVFLNTDSRMEVRYEERVRRVMLHSGEAMFEVARDPARPFVVSAGERRIRALGTVFLVRREADELAVTLLEGKVAVEAAGEDSAPQALLEPGQRLVLSGRMPPKLDAPAVEKVTAWRRGLVDFENTPLAEAAAEMNRYSEIRLVIESPEASDIPINGVFRTGDSRSFAAAVARAYGLEVRAGRDEIRLSGTGNGGS